MDYLSKMHFHYFTPSQKRPAADLLVVPLIQGKGHPTWPAALGRSSAALDIPIKLGDFEGKEGQISVQYHAKEGEPRTLLLGLGGAETLTVEKVRRGFALAAKTARTLKAATVALLMPTQKVLSEEELLKGALEGIFLANYSFDFHKAHTLKETPPFVIKGLQLVTSCKEVKAITERLYAIAEGVHSARDLVNMGADLVTPHYLAEHARKIAAANKKIRLTVFDKKQLEKEGFGLLLAVGRGAPVGHEPVCIIAEYHGDPKSKETTVLVGKGVTYDTGGLNLKPTGYMETMRCDMAGAAAVLATLQVVAALKLKKNITVVVPAAENSIGSRSFKPGDVYSSYSGKTVEVGNTDAEGRLILADALHYAVKKLKPTHIVDLATLTGAVEIALGSEATGLFSNNDVLADRLLRAGTTTYERLWRFPLYEEYKEGLKSPIADLKNHGGGRSAGSILGALFLQEFIDGVPWAHLDIAATAFLSEAKSYQPKHATGIGVRLLVEFLDPS